MASKITKEEVKKAAALARLELTEKEETMYTEQLSAILGYIKQLEEVDTDNVAVTSQVTGLSNVMREDRVEACNSVEELIKAAPSSENNLVKVRAVFE